MASDFPSLASDRLTLREARSTDAPRYHEILSIPEVTRYNNLPDRPSEARSERFVRWMRRLHDKGKGCAWIIEQRGDGALIGAIRLDEIHRHSRYGVIGYESHPDFWGQGVMSEALAAVARCAFEHYSLNRLEAWTLFGNVASERVLLGNGFRYEGTLHQRARFKDRFHDLRMFGRLAPSTLAGSRRAESDRRRLEPSEHV